MIASLYRVLGRFFLERAQSMAADANLCLVIGTSAVVYTAAGGAAAVVLPELLED